jgi:hypothetical protein
MGKALAFLASLEDHAEEAAKLLKGYHRLPKKAEVSDPLSVLQTVV